MRFTLRGISISGSLSFLFLLFLTAQFAHILLVRDFPVFFFISTWAAGAGPRGAHLAVFAHVAGNVVTTDEPA